jgi:hypothetical protein
MVVQVSLVCLESSLTNHCLYLEMYLCMPKKFTKYKNNTHAEFQQYFSDMVNVEKIKINKHTARHMSIVPRRNQ